MDERMGSRETRGLENEGKTGEEGEEGKRVWDLDTAQSSLTPQPVSSTAQPLRPLRTSASDCLDSTGPRPNASRPFIFGCL